MQPAMKVAHVVVDGSNIATEGRDAPSLAQLDEAVQAFVEEYEPDHVTVVVDATFPNRIDRKERKTYEDAVNANELITPPAGAIGRGDAFVLQIARRAGAAILSNDSFQEFHGEYPWLFDRGRLIGGKPVPKVGWVFMDRAPVRGPTSRRAVGEAKKAAKAAEKAEKKSEKKAEKTDKTSTARAGGDAADDGASPKPSRRRRSRSKVAAGGVAAAAGRGDRSDGAAGSAPEASGGGGEGDRGRQGSGKGPDPYNEALPFIEFVAEHPVGSEVDATVERFSSHGAYVMVGQARGYVPLANLADPAPRSAKEVLGVGEQRRFVVVSIDTPRRGIDLAVPGVGVVPEPDAPAGAAETPAGDDAAAPDGGSPATSGRAKRSSAKKTAAKKTTAKEGAAKKAGMSSDEPTSDATAPRKAPAKKAAANTSSARKAPAKKAATKKATARKAPAKKAASRTPGARKAPAKKAAVKKSAADNAGAGDGPDGNSATDASGNGAPSTVATPSGEPDR
jgi:predicted RNA-binding protein with RPS1 domain